MIQRGPHRCYVQNRPVSQWRNSKILGGNEEKKKTLVFFFFYLGMVWASWVALNSVARLCPTFCSPMDCSTPGFPVHHQLPELMSTESMMPSNHLVLCCPLLLLPSIFPSIRVFSDESILHIRWLEYWSFSLSPSNEYSELISLGLTGLILAVIHREIFEMVQNGFGL